MDVDGAITAAKQFELNHQGVVVVEFTERTSVGKLSWFVAISNSAKTLQEKCNLVRQADGTVMFPKHHAERVFGELIDAGEKIVVVEQRR